MGGWFTKELTGVESVYKGLRYRMPGVGGEGTLRRLGAVVVNLPASEIIPSLRSGAIDASEFAGPWVDLALGLNKAAQILLLPGLSRARSGPFRSSSTRSCGIASTAPSAVSSRRPRPQRPRFPTQISPPTTPSRSSSSPTIRQSRSVNSMIPSWRRSARSPGEVLYETSRNDDLTRRGLRQLHQVPDLGAAVGEMSRSAPFSMRARCLPVRRMIAAGEYRPVANNVRR